MNNQQAIDRLVKHLEWGWSKKTVDAIEMGIHALKETQWIPCSERMPVESGTYVVNAIENHMVHVTFAKWMPRMKKWNLTGSRSYWKVTAWQPLPHPFQPKGE